jgi:hypothetical protein
MVKKLVSCPVPGSTADQPFVESSCKSRAMKNNMVKLQGLLVAARRVAGTRDSVCKTFRWLESGFTLIINFNLMFYIDKYNYNTA